MIKIFVSMLAMFVIDAIVSYLQKRDNTSRDITQNDNNYVVRPPAALTYVYLIGFGFGMFLFCFFGFFYQKHNPTVTKGHLYFALIFSAICLLVVIRSSTWKVYVNGENLAYYKIFHRRPVLLSVDEIGEIEIGKKQEIVLYDKSGKKVFTVDGLSDNYSRFCKTLGIKEPK